MNHSLIGFETAICMCEEYGGVDNPVDHNIETPDRYFIAGV
jgi:hypothetical protein